MLRHKITQTTVRLIQFLCVHVCTLLASSRLEGRGHHRPQQEWHTKQSSGSVLNLTCAWQRHRSVNANTEPLLMRVAIDLSQRSVSENSVGCKGGGLSERQIVRDPSSYQLDNQYLKTRSKPLRKDLSKWLHSLPAEMKPLLHVVFGCTGCWFVSIYVSADVVFVSVCVCVWVKLWHYILSVSLCLALYI